MFGLSPAHLIFFAIVVLILFGRGRISEFMGDFGKGIKSFKQGIADEENKPASPPPARIPAQPADSATPAATEASKSEQP